MTVNLSYTEEAVIYIIGLYDILIICLLQDFIHLTGFLTHKCFAISLLCMKAIISMKKKKKEIT